MSEILKNSNSRNLFKWYEQHREENDQKTIALNKKNLTNEWNQYRPVITNLYRNTLEDQASTQKLLIDQIINRLDDIQSYDDYKYNGYAYSSPTHKNITCWNGGNLKQNGYSFTIHKPIDKKINNSKNLKLAPIPPSRKVYKSKEMDYVNKLIANLNDSNSLKNNFDNQPIQISPSVESLLKGLDRKKSTKNTPDLSNIVNQSDNDSIYRISPTSNKENTPDSMKDISSDDLIEYLKSKDLIQMPENSRDTRLNSTEKRPKRIEAKKEKSTNLTTIPELTLNTDVNKNLSENFLETPSETPLPSVALFQPSEHKNQIKDSNNSEKERINWPRFIESEKQVKELVIPIKKVSQNQNESALQPRPPSIPAPPPLPSNIPAPPPISTSLSTVPLNLIKNKTEIELVTSSGEESNYSKIPENFLSEIVETKKKLKPLEEPKIVEEKIENDVSFVQELKDYLLKIKEKHNKNDLDIVKKESSPNPSPQPFKTSSESYNTPSLFPSTSSNTSINKKEIEYGQEFKVNISRVNSNVQSEPSKNSFKALKSEILYDPSIESGDEREKISGRTINMNENINRMRNSSSSNSTLFSDFLQDKIFSLNEEKKGKEFKEDIILNIFNENFPELKGRGAPLVYQCHSQETDFPLKNILLKLFFDLEKYSQSDRKELDLLIHPMNLVPRSASVDNASFNFQKTESETYIGDLNESQSNNTIASREEFFENLRQLIEESQDETDTDFQRSFQNLNEFYNNLLKKYQDKYRKTENIEVVSSAISEEGEPDSYDNFLHSSQTQFSDSSIIQSEMSDVYKSEQKKIVKVPFSSLIVVDEISEDNSSDTIFRPVSKKRIDTESYEKMNISSGIDDKTIAKIPKLSRSRSRNETLSQENMNISTDSDDTTLRPALRKTPTKYKSRLNSIEMDKVYNQEEKKLSSANLNKLPKTETNSIWFDLNENNKENLRPKSVPINETKKNEKERPKSVVFSDDIFESKDEKERPSSVLSSDGSKNFEPKNEIKESKEPKENTNSLAKIWSEISKIEDEKREKKNDEKQNQKISYLFNIWKEAREVTKKRSEMVAYQRISIEQRAHELEKILEIDDLEKKDDSDSDNYIELAPGPKSLINITHTSKIQNLVNKFENPDQNLKKDEPSISIYVSVKDKLKRFDSAGTTDSDNSKKTRIGGLLISKDVKIDSGKVVQTQSSFKDPAESSKAFSLQANNFLNKLKGDNLREDYDDLKFKKKKADDELETRKSLTLSENLAQVDEISRSSLNLQEDTSKYSTINNKDGSDMSESSLKLTNNSDEKSNSDYDKYFELASSETSSEEIPVQMEKKKLRSSKKSEISHDSLNFSGDYQIRRNDIVFASNKISDKEDEPEEDSKESSKIENNSQERDSFILDKILLKTDSIDPDQKKFFRENSNSNSDESSETSNIELNKIQQSLAKRKIKSQQSFQGSILTNYNTDIENEAIPMGPAPETVEIIRRLKQPSQSANVGIFGLERVGESNQKQKLSGGKQRKPNEETIAGENELEYRRTKSSNSMNSNRYKLFNRLFNRDKSDKNSSGPKKKKKF